MRLLYVPSEVCYVHNLQRAIEIAFGRGSKPTQNASLAALIRKHDRISQRFHQSTKMTKQLQEKQKAAGIREGKTLNVAVNSRTRWNSVHATTARNNILMAAISAVLAEAPRSSRADDDTGPDDASEIERALCGAFGTLDVDATGRRIPRRRPEAHGDIDEEDDNSAGSSESATAATAAAHVAAGAAAAAAAAAAATGGHLRDPEPANDDDVHVVDPSTLILNASDKRDSLYVEGMLRKPGGPWSRRLVPLRMHAHVALLVPPAPTPPRSHARALARARARTSGSCSQLSSHSDSRRRMDRRARPFWQRLIACSLVSKATTHRREKWRHSTCRVRDLSAAVPVRSPRSRGTTPVCQPRAPPFVESYGSRWRSASRFCHRRCHRQSSA